MRTRPKKTLVDRSFVYSDFGCDIHVGHPLAVQFKHLLDFAHLCDFSCNIAFMSLKGNKKVLTQ